MVLVAVLVVGADEVVSGGFDVVVVVITVGVVVVTFVDVVAVVVIKVAISTSALLVVAGIGWPLISPNTTFDRVNAALPVIDLAVKITFAKVPWENTFLPGEMMTPLTALIRPFVLEPGWKNVLAPL